MFSDRERQFAQAVSGLAVANPFRPDEVQRFEAEALAAGLPDGTRPVQEIDERPHVAALVGQADRLLSTLGKREVTASEPDVRLHAQVVRFVLYFQFRQPLQRSVEQGFAEPERMVAPWYNQFRDLLQRMTLPALRGDPLVDPEHVIACFFQIRRAYFLIQSQLIGSSRPMQALRAAAWESVFTTDLVQYGRLLYDRMHDVSTLVIGPSGTGKELVARAIGLSRYIRFDGRSRKFAEPFVGAFHPVNLSALSPTLIESELFGHAKGAFTGATSARDGWFETCRSGHAVFLDEIGELDPALQVKLLRVLQERTFQRIGEIAPRRFMGKVIAATNRDLVLEMSQERFRSDLYYRLCSDVIETPSLHAQLLDRPGDLNELVTVLVRRQVGQDVPEIVERNCSYIQKHLADYDWPGNVRELEQCIRSVLLRGRYVPLSRGGATKRERLARTLARDTLSCEQLLNAYCQVIYDEVGTYSEVARILGIDRRTVQKRVDAKES